MVACPPDIPVFKDHFSGGAAAYTRYRPHYPPALFTHLASLVSKPATAWDCGCGNGQASLGLVEHFERVVASDPSAAQIEHAEPHPRIDYRVAPAEASGLAAHSVDLVSVAQALHWFDLARFYAEVRRVVRPGGVLAVYGYGLLRIAPELDRLIRSFYTETVGPYWPPERRHIDTGYASLPFDFPELSAPPFAMTAHWELEHLFGYLGTWSAVKACAEQTGRNPIDALRAPLAAAWGEPQQARAVRWPLFLRAGRVKM